MLAMEGIFFKVTFLTFLISALLYIVYTSSRKEGIWKLASYLGIIGLLSLTVSMVSRTISADRLPFSNMYEYNICFAWGVVLVHLFVERKFKIKILGVFVLPIAFLLILYASQLSNEIVPLVPALQSNWLVAHVAVAIIAYGAFAVSFGLSVMYLIKEKLKDSNNIIIQQLPQPEVLDRLTHQVIIFAFPFMTLCVITGAVWAEKAWGTYWAWDPKETWSLITWLIYAAYLHTRFVYGWKGKKAAWLSIIGFLAVIFTYLGVNLLLSGLHSYV